ncbi:hypothetical protein [uncultured Amaricoccus sp.]|mgnify:CR=1 FL=1|uniref:hypothetical protein n=1 Tax=uncultured Amaricoccus sp. TaxID=339341 RepID=UPI00262679C2|nr:hypothetical protein [uncultured Amaricoccus sp.]
MPSAIYHSAIRDLFTGAVDADTDSFKVMLVTSSYSPNKDTDDKRNDVTNEVSGTGYTAGGASATLGVSIDTTNDRIEISLGGASWPASTITARGAVYYKSRGGASSADELVAYIDFGANVVSEAGTFALTASTIRIQN